MDVLMPQLGETVAEGKITKWFKAAGDAVKQGDNLFEIETDKVSMEVPSTTAGVLSDIRVGAGEVAPVGAVVAVIVREGAAAPAPARAASAPAPKAVPPVAATAAQPQTPLQQRLSGAASFASSASQSAPAAAPIPLDPFFEVRTPERNYGPAKLPGGAVSTPLARRLASERGIDLSQIKGSGPHGRVVAADVPARALAAIAAMRAAAAQGPTASEVRALYQDRPFEEIALDGMRATIATRLVQAKQTIPHFYLTADVEIGRLLALREEVNSAAPKDKAGTPVLKISINDFIIKAWAAALQRIPAANAVWAEIGRASCRERV